MDEQKRATIKIIDGRKVALELDVPVEAFEFVSERLGDGKLRLTARVVVKESEAC